MIGAALVSIDFDALAPDSCFFKVFPNRLGVSETWHYISVRISYQQQPRTDQATQKRTAPS
jgi:hypothetical protein